MTTTTNVLDLDMMAPTDPLELAALRFHQRNPHILAEVIRIALPLRLAGRKRWSIGGAFEVVRYNATVTSDGRTYRLNNNHRAFYARWAMEQEPRLAGFFVTREVGRIRQEYDE